MKIYETVRTHAEQCALEASEEEQRVAEELARLHDYQEYVAAVATADEATLLDFLMKELVDLETRRHPYEEFKFVLRDEAVIEAVLKRYKELCE